MDERILAGIGERVRSGDFPNVHAVVVVADGTVAFEDSFSGPDESIVELVTGATDLPTRLFRPGSLHDVRSVTKSITSLLYGTALRQGAVPGPDTPVLDAFPEHDDVRGSGWERVLVRHALTMTLGVEWDETIPYTDPRNSEIQMHTSPDPYRYVLTRPVVSPPGEGFTYCGGATELLAALVQKGTGLRLDDYAREMLFRPLGIEDFEWARPAHGHPMGASGLRLRAPDLAKIASLYLTGGRWGDRTIAPAEWLAASLAPHVTNDAGRYGFQWWLSRSGRIASAVGNGGQRAVVVPECDLVAVVLAGNYNAPGESYSDRLLSECVLPAAGIAAPDGWWAL